MKAWVIYRIDCSLLVPKIYCKSSGSQRSSHDHQSLVDNEEFCGRSFRNKDLRIEGKTRCTHETQTGKLNEAEEFVAPW